MFALCVALALTGCQTSRARYSGPLIARPANCVDIDFPIYFEGGSASVTREADRRIVDASQRANGCRVTGIDVMGLADAPGAPEVNYLLSQRRAKAVAEALRRRGFRAVEPNEGAAGAINATAASGAERPLRRRADVAIHLAPRTAPASH